MYREGGIYCCYSKNLRDYLYHYGVKYQVVGINPNSGKMFWAYCKNERLDELLQKWSDDSKRYAEEG